MEKISFLYVSQIFPGKISRSLNYPQPWIKPDEHSGKISIDVSFGLIIKTKVNYRVDVDLFLATRELISVVVSHCNQTLLWLARPLEVSQ